ncbi:uncharacterized protein LOC114133351 [Xiphophorus couchianus]|uniref:uncharacterized protein LOC114133351 n=1 Tax=Xiphophorus couchianus TaxID=32473 RepID=UPI001016103A|nr:uncharacterized protein LOC114133351 [Xiphophorus couchianus]
MGCQEFKIIKLETASVVGHTEAVYMNSPKERKMKILPRGLVGTKSTGQVQIKGDQFNCLLDSSSQVTTIPYSFYNTYITDHKIKPINNLLEIEGANGQTVPYLGYVEVNITFPPELFGLPVEVDTFALVVPDIKPSQHLILIGTNTLDVAYSKRFDTHPDQSFQPMISGFIAVYKILQHRYAQSLNDYSATVTLQSNQPQVITAGQTTVVEGCLAARLWQDEKQVLLENPSSYALPGGLMVKTCLIDLPQHRPCHPPVVISNESDHEIHIPARAVIAEISTFQSVISQEQKVQNSTQSTESLQPSQPQYNFGDSPLSPEWKQRIIQKLNSIPEVFAKHDLDRQS